MGKIQMSVPALNYTGTKGSGPVLADGKHVVHMSAVVLTDDETANPWGDDQGTIKLRGYDDSYPTIACKFSNPSGGISERYHFFGFRRGSDLTEAEKAMTTKVKGINVPMFDTDVETGYALTFLIGDDGKKVGIETGEVVNGKAVKRAAKVRVVDEGKSATATRIFCDLLVACGIPAIENLTPEKAVEALHKVVRPIGITVTSQQYNGKRRAHMTNPTFVNSAVATDAVHAEAEPEVFATDDDF